MGSSSHGSERKGQLGPAVTVPMSGTHLKRDEGWDPTRNTEVSFIGNNTRSFELEGLGKKKKKESWTLISKITFGG